MELHPNLELVVRLGNIVQEFIEDHDVLGEAIYDGVQRRALFVALVMLAASVLTGPDEIETIVAIKTAEAVNPACQAILDAWRSAVLEMN